MKHTTTKEVPARTVNVDRYTCDCCGKPVKDPGNCRICGGHVCYECTVFDDGDYGDYPPRYCEPCWSIGAAYREKRKVLEADCDDGKGELTSQWYAEARSQAKNRTAKTQ